MTEIGVISEVRDDHVRVQQGTTSRVSPRQAIDGRWRALKESGRLTEKWGEPTAWSTARWNPARWT
jgi:hypothetical protein